MNAPLDFTAFFREVHGPAWKPFPWQIELAKRVLQKGWPEQIDLPTAAGKTSVLDIAVFALAAQAAEANRQMPLRIFFVIDRRVVVDQAARHAEKLARMLKKGWESPAKYPALHAVAARLMEFGGYTPLHVAVLRGGVYRDPAWYYAPNQPLICLSTVDQVGSRLLFRGYGVSETMRPIHAGLIGCDSLIFVDEAHLSAPFVDTLRSVRCYLGPKWADAPINKPFAAVEMSATQRVAKSEPFRLLPADYANPILKPRLAASKRASLEAPDNFEKATTEKVKQFLMANAVQVVGVIVNRVASARAIFESLKADDGIEVILLTGRARSYDREFLLKERLSFVASGRDRSQHLPRKFVVVATQTIEVGADLDFDALVTEAASLDALRQRFGRLDRLGELKISFAWILLRRIDESASTKEDPIYGSALAATWKWLLKQAGLKKKRAPKKKTSEAPVDDARPFVDFGILALKERLDAFADAVLLSVSRKSAPVLLPSCLDTLVQTSPTPNPDPDVAVFLHGAESVSASDVQIVWRADLLPGDEGHWSEIVSILPPRSGETISVPLFAVTAWLRQRRPIDIVDLEGADLSTRENGGGEPRPVCLWAGKDDTCVVPSPKGQNGRKGLRPGDTIVVPTAYGGCDIYGWNPQDPTPVTDVGDFIQRGRLIGLRLFAARFEGMNSDAISTWLRFVRARDQEDTDASEAALTELLTLLTKETSKDSPEKEHPTLSGSMMRHQRAELRTVATAILRATRPPIQYPRSKPINLFLSIRSPKAGVSLVDVGSSEPEPANEDDDGSRSDGPVQLADHSAGVEKKAKEFAKRCCLSDDLAHDIGVAARVHDIGKADPRFQALLHGGDWRLALIALQANKPLAKSDLLPVNSAGYRAARDRSGFPKGGRHELISAGLIRQNPNLLNGDLSTDARNTNLVSHLVATHHGYARPFPPAIPDHVGTEIKFGNPLLTGSSRHGLDDLASGWTDQFWSLVERYGYWGLCYLEAILRIADHRQSQEEEK